MNEIQYSNYTKIQYLNSSLLGLLKLGQQKTQVVIEHQDDKRAESREQVSKLAGRQAGERAALSHREVESVAEAVNGRKTSTEIGFL